MAVGAENGSGTPLDLAQHTLVPKPRRRVVATPPPVGHRIFSASGLRKKVRRWEIRHDIRPKERVRRLAAIWEKQTTPDGKSIVLSAMKRVARQTKRARYPIFYKVGPLVEKAFEDVDLQSLPIGRLVDRLILQLRLTTLARSGDLAATVWGLFTQGGRFFVHFIDKNAALQVHSLQQNTVATVREYLARHLYMPGELLVGCVSDPFSPMSAQRIAKRTLLGMKQVGIDTSVFKAHSLRGATATHFLEKGVQRDHVRARGGWKSNQVLDEYYARIHQAVTWEWVLLGGSGTRGMSGCASPRPTAPQTEGDEGNRRGGAEGRGEAQTDILAARGVLRPLHSPTMCAICMVPVHAEAAFACFSCNRAVHVR